MLFLAAAKQSLPLSLLGSLNLKLLSQIVGNFYYFCTQNNFGHAVFSIY